MRDWRGTKTEVNSWINSESSRTVKQKTPPLGKGYRTRLLISGLFYIDWRNRRFPRGANIFVPRELQCLPYPHQKRTYLQVFYNLERASITGTMVFSCFQWTGSSHVLSRHPISPYNHSINPSIRPKIRFHYAGFSYPCWQKARL